MKKLLILLFVASLSAVPSYGAETIKMLNDGSPAYSMKILEDGFGGHSAGTVLSTFCLESNEVFWPGRSYYAVLNTGATFGGEGPGGFDPIDAETAYLYTQFINGHADFQNQGKLQNAIWYLEGEGGQYNSYVTAAQTAVEDGLWSGIGNVRVANLWERFDGQNYYGAAQDQLMMISPVPAPGALLLAGLGTMIVGFVRRRK